MVVKLQSSGSLLRQRYTRGWTRAHALPSGKLLALPAALPVLLPLSGSCWEVVWNNGASAVSLAWYLPKGSYLSK